jgi:vacuolar-type H+-ATPase subunit E/Vma4
MTLERLVEEIRGRTASEIAEEQKRVDGEKQRIVADRDRRIERIREEAARQSAADVERERIQRLAAAKLVARKLVFEAEEGRARKAIGGVREMLNDYTDSPEYPTVLKGMYAYAVSELGAGMKVTGRKEDADVLRSLAGKGFQATPVPMAGGLIAETADGSRRLNLSFDELLRLREDRVRSLLKV